MKKSVCEICQGTCIKGQGQINVQIKKYFFLSVALLEYHFALTIWSYVVYATFVYILHYIFSYWPILPTYRLEYWLRPVWSRRENEIIFSTTSKACVHITSHLLEKILMFEVENYAPKGFVQLASYLFIKIHKNVWQLRWLKYMQSIWKCLIPTFFASKFNIHRELKSTKDG